MTTYRPRLPKMGLPRVLCAKGRMSIGSFDMSTLKFVEDNFDSLLDTYDVLEVVTKQIGGRCVEPWPPFFMVS
jgi:hypothetical protein